MHLARIRSSVAIAGILLQDEYRVRQTQNVSTGIAPDVQEICLLLSLILGSVALVPAWFKRRIVRFFRRIGTGFFIFNDFRIDAFSTEFDAILNPFSVFNTVAFGGQFIDLRGVCLAPLSFWPIYSSLAPT